MITIHFDFANGTEISYKEGLNKKDDFNTCCLDFFCFDTNVDDVVIKSKNGNTLSRNNLLKKGNKHTLKEIRKSHNILKMFKSNSFNW